MAKPRIYTRQALRENTQLQLEEAPSRHLAGALRLRSGAALTLFNGEGGEYDATIISLDRKKVSVELGRHRQQERESQLRVELGIAVSRGERMDWVVQKATELGVSVISPLWSERTEVKLSAEREEKKLRHWQQVSISACEQCGRNQLPEIQGPQALATWCQSVLADRKLVLHHRAEKDFIHGATPDSVALLVGPEGGLSDMELSSATGQGFSAMALGPRVLRTETAPLAAIAILQARWGDMAPATRSKND